MKECVDLFCDDSLRTSRRSKLFTNSFDRCLKNDTVLSSTGKAVDYVLYRMDQLFDGADRGVKKYYADPLWIDLRAWVTDLIGFTNNATVLLAVIYLERLAKASPKPLKAVLRHRLIFISTVLANKYLDDHAPVLRCWAIRSRCWSLRDVVRFEIGFLKLVDYRLAVLGPEFAMSIMQANKVVAATAVMPRPAPSPRVDTTSLVLRGLRSPSSLLNGSSAASTASECSTAIAPLEAPRPVSVIFVDQSLGLSQEDNLTSACADFVEISKSFREPPRASFHDEILAAIDVEKATAAMVA
eukprot:Rmarinus@m.22158